MIEENTELELVSNNEEVAPAKKVTKKKVAKKVAKKVEKAIPCDECKSRNICKAQGYCKHG